MTNQQVQTAVRSRGLSRKGKNSYTQGSKRTQVATGYSDCSSFARWCWLMVLGIDIGIYTGAQISDSDMLTVHKGGNAPDVSKLQVGDLIYWWSSKSTNPQKVSHVEVVIEVGSTLAKCKLLGHGGGKGPTIKPSLKDYCATHNYLMTRRPKLTEKTWTLGQRIISKGCYGEDVYAMQCGLILLGYALGTDGADWDCGDATDTAIRKFQKAYGLTVDGQFGPNSLKKFNALVLALEPELPINDAPLTEDDYPDDDEIDTSPAESNSDAPDDPDAQIDPDDMDADDTQEPASDTADGYMGVSAINPYPMPTKLKQKGSKGATVKWIQWALRDHGYTTVTISGKKKTLKVDGDFGSITTAAVKAFQRKNTDASGKKLTVDGQVGAKTREVLDIWVGEVVDAPGATAQVTTGDTRKCPDISYYDGKPTWSKVNVPFIWIREGDSNRKRDPEFERNVKGAVQYGIPWGSYLFFRAGTVAQAKKDIDTFVKRVKGTGVTPRNYVLDVETSDPTPVTVKAALTYMREQLGPDAQIGIYIGHHWYSTYKSVVKLFDFYWVPRYNGWKTPPAYAYHVWQGGPGSFAGIRGGAKSVDCNKLKPGLDWPKMLAQRAV